MDAAHRAPAIDRATDSHTPLVLRRVDVTAVVAFRPLRRDDFPLVTAWLAEPLVARWWSHETSMEAVERDFGASVDGHDAAEVFLAIACGRPFGLIQRYAIAGSAEYLAELSAICNVPPGALSIDYLIGEPDFRGRGLGAAMIAAVVEDTWRAFPAAADILVPVALGNRASWRSLERSGFTRIAEGQLTPDNPIDPRDHVVYHRERG